MNHEQTEPHSAGPGILLSGPYSEGSRRGMTHNRMARLVCRNPGKRYGLLDKGAIEVGYDANLVMLERDEKFTVRAAGSGSSQGNTAFEGIELSGRVKSNGLRGQLDLP